jgi:menaquinol-cytochrome c reductase cytochrome b/c subunit
LSEHQKDHPEKVYYVGDSRVSRNRSKRYPKDYAEFPGKTEAFFPDFLLKEWMVAVVFLVGFMVLVMTEKPPLGDIADPTNTSFLPVPDWYFLFLYQLLKYKWAAGKFVTIGTMVVPGIAFSALLLVPWLDRSHQRQPLKRPIATTIMILSLTAIVTLTWAAEHEHELQIESAPGLKPKNTQVIAKDEAGFRYYKQNACIKCHGDHLQGVNGPSLLSVGNRRSKEDIIKYMDEGKGVMPAGMFQGSQPEKEELARWLTKQKQK